MFVRVCEGVGVGRWDGVRGRACLDMCMSQNVLCVRVCVRVRLCVRMIKLANILAIITAAHLGAREC